MEHIDRPASSSAYAAETFFRAGWSATGQYRCVECDYGVMVRTQLPVCPICGGRTWEATSWSPFANVRPAAPPL
jgi:rubrerythrin